MLGTLMITIGATLLIGSVAAAYYLITQACGSPCQESLARLLSDMMIANEGIFFWLAWVVGIFLIWGGMRVRAYVGR